jgi:RNA polymerase sigma factor (sigma-70 family)
MISRPGDQRPAPGREFRTTHWSVVLSAGGSGSSESGRALEKLCQMYWYPLYAFVRRKGYQHDEAQDLTQAFFAKLLQKNQIALADPDRGRFRTFLLHSMENFLRSYHRDASALKRGGGREVISLDAEMAEQRYAAQPEGTIPTAVYEREWIGTMLESVLATVRREFSVSGKEELFGYLEPHLWGDDTSTPYAQVAELLDMTVVSVRVTIHRLRQRFHDLLREKIAETVADASEIEDEIRYLRRVLAG